ncbi:hypothetical protein K1T35_14210 [Pseudonocardia sp. DSM 110487]|uniref:DUF5994 family protein n=1 Tax=Pseudonocardia sp. DSM 110487 TaxID=2865833 RepID=UPI001C6A55E5|nr:DUF5994 family protein [Pseudonocardia sp. DSM 110487]QYN38275.1 hypothetical protein K1T35_14210 [Pseudonocardia sp. DSM 110487]
MASVSIIRSVSPIGDHQNVRLQLKPHEPATGFVDGGWWPHSRDLPVELPALLAGLAVGLGPVESVSYNLDAWDPAPRKITIGGRIIRLAGYRSQHPATIDVLSAGHRVTLLVVPPEATPEAAHGTLMAAGHRGNADGIDALLLTGSADEVAQERRELDGAPVRMHAVGSRPVRAPDA